MYMAGYIYRGSKSYVVDHTIVIHISPFIVRPIALVLIYNLSKGKRFGCRAGLSVACRPRHAKNSSQAKHQKGP
jgi:hypothetical protein